MKGNKAKLLTLAEKCKNILASNWKGHLNTIKADAKGSKEGIYTSKVKYIIRRGKPYIWVPEKDLHNVIARAVEDKLPVFLETNTVIDERGSFAVANQFPGHLATLLKSMKKLPARVALTGDVVPLKDEKVRSVLKSLEEVILSEQKAISQLSYTASGVLSSSNHILTSQSENLKDLLNGDENYVVYKFTPRSCMFIDGHGGRSHEIDLEDLETSKADALAPFSAKLIDGINQSGSRCRALMLFCLIYLNAKAKDARMLSIDRKGFDVLGKVAKQVKEDGKVDSEWKEFRFIFKEEAEDVESFCRLLVEMEEEAVKKVSSYSGLG